MVGDIVGLDVDDLLDFPFRVGFAVVGTLVASLDDGRSDAVGITVGQYVASMGDVGIGVALDFLPFFVGDAVVGIGVFVESDVGNCVGEGVGALDLLVGEGVGEGIGALDLLVGEGVGAGVGFDFLGRPMGGPGSYSLVG